MKEEKKNKFSLKIIILIIVVLIIGLIIGFIYLGKDTNLYNSIFISNKSEAIIKNSLGDNFIAYIPLDDRPVNIDRVKYLSQSMGYTLKMPDSDLYSTKLDGNGTNSNGTQYGDSYRLAKWLQEMENLGCDYYIISLDQLFSGGLANSRILTENDEIERNIDISFIKYIFESIISDNTNKIYLYDSVMRLASTDGYLSFRYNDYKNIYNYASVERKLLDGDSLTIDNIVNGYRYDSNNQIIKHNIEENKISKYLSARERKIKLIDYYFSVIENNNNVKLFVGIDDSSNGNSIQTNEISYINKVIKEKNLNIIVRDGIDELGMLVFARLVSDNSNYPLNVKTIYYGGSELNKASKFSSQTIKDNYESLMNCLDVNHVDTNENISVLIYTDPKDVNLIDKYAIDLVNQYIYNINNHIPTIIIDSSDPKYGKIFEEILVNNAPLGYLIGYSSWNDFSNSSGIAISEGITRYLYLIGNNKNEDSDKAFVKLMTFSYIKDMVYKGNVDSLLGNVSNSDYVSKFMTTYNNGVIRNLENSNFISNLSDYSEKSINMITLSDYRFPWNRLFEMSFTIDLKIDKPKDIVINTVVIETGSENNNSESNNENNNESNNNNEYIGNDKENNNNDEEFEDSNNESSNDSKKKITHYSFIADSVNKDGKFYPDDYISRKEIAKWVCQANNLNIVSSYTGYYSDVKKGTSNWNYIETATKYGYFKGDNKNKFNPNQFITRAELVSLVVQIAEKNNIVLSKIRDISFSDIKSNEWYYNKIILASEAGLINGYEDGTFKPNSYSTRAEAVAIISRLFDRDETHTNCTEYPNNNPFSDVNEKHWSYNYLLEAYYEHSCDE